MSVDIFIRNNILTEIERSETDVTALPPDASLICEADWKQMVEEAGSEEKLIEQLGVKDGRDADIA